MLTLPRLYFLNDLNLLVIRRSGALSAGREVSVLRLAAVSASRNAGACSQFQSIKCENLTRSLLVVRDSAPVHAEGEIQSHRAAVVSAFHLTVITQFHEGGFKHFTSDD